MSDSFARFKIRCGWVEVICGCMYSGKTEELIQQIRRASLAQQKFQVFKPKIDDRYSKDHIASHNQNKFPAHVVESADQILEKVEKNTEVVGIDEGQFFSDKLIEVAEKLAHADKRVLIAGLDTDWQGRPFGPMPNILSIAEIIHKQYAICTVCGESATRTQRLTLSQEDILVGSTEAYEARCRRHFDPTLSLRLSQVQKKKVNTELQSHST